MVSTFTDKTLKAGRQDATGVSPYIGISFSCKEYEKEKWTLSKHLNLQAFPTTNKGDYKSSKPPAIKTPLGTTICQQHPSANHI